MGSCIQHPVKSQRFLATFLARKHGDFLIGWRWFDPAPHDPNVVLSQGAKTSKASSSEKNGRRSRTASPKGRSEC